MFLNTKRAMTFIEILVAFCIFSMLWILTVQCIEQQKQQVRRKQQGLSEMISLQSALSFMQHSIRFAGFTGCRRLDQLTLYNMNGALLSPLTFLDIDQQSHALKIRRVDEKTLMHIEKISERMISVDHIPLFFQNKQQYKVLLSDCDHGELHEVEAVDVAHHLLFLSEPVRFDYEPYATLGLWVDEMFYIKKMKSFFGLFYHAQRSDRLFYPLVSWSVARTQDIYPLIRIQLNRPQQKTIEMDIRVKMPGG